jgi:sterol desaturase/sphingolipid hydroxylase (fatty acid hydroxylase superfamily)
MSLILYAIPVFVFFLLLEAWISHRRALGVYRLHDAITSLNIGLISEVFRGLQKLVTVLIYGTVVEKVGVIHFDASSPVVWVLAFFLYDFFYYWAHRAGHEVNLLWAAHVVHHSSEEFNLSTALRQSSTNTIFYWVFYLPMALLGIPTTVFAITVLISLLYQYWIHTRLIGKLGWFERVFNTPSHHRVHHGQNEYCIDKNYAATLIIWDRMFGTFEEEREDEPVVYGALTPLHSWNPVWANFKNYIGLVQGVVQLPGWRNKLMHLFAPPGWTPQTGMPGAPPPLRFEPAHFQRFETAAPTWQRVYGVLACAVTVLMLVHWLTLGVAAPVAQRAAYGAVIIANATLIGWVFAGLRWAVVLEAVRAALVFGVLAAGVWFTPVSSGVQAIALAALLASLALLYRVYRQAPLPAAHAQGVRT